MPICELYHDNFQNYKCYGIPHAQLVIATASIRPCLKKSAHSGLQMPQRTRQM